MPASPSTARAINDRLALRLLQREGPLTAGQLKKLTGLSRPSVADLVERLAEAGLIGVVGESGEQRRGPNARLYGIVADRAHLAALDVRTEGVAVVVADLLGAVLAEASVPIADETDTVPAVERAVALVEHTAKEAGVERLHTVGVGAPGLIDPATGELRDSTGLPEWHRRLAAALQERFAARVVVENETNLAALAEQREGAARDRDTFVLLWLGHGIGAAVVLDGVLRRGASGGTGEIGFLPVPGTGGMPSATGCEGGFHSLAGAAAIVELAREYGVSASVSAHEPYAAALVREAVARVSGAARGATATPVSPSAPAPALTPGSTPGPRSAPVAPAPAAASVSASAQGVGGRVDSSAGSEGYPRSSPRPFGGGGDQGASGFLDVLADRVALGVASVIAVLDPGCVVLSGEVGRAGGETLAARVRERLGRMTPLPTEVRAGTLGGGAVLRGALLMARDGAQDELFAPPER
ncbi:MULTISPECIES: ROK family transcriptional regulator [Streptomyces]|uniref:ROK family transcriptional regulator n=1 Tax=Streptomyces ortus TaxID=2867268 RepID=A0ABT3V0R8_9ACTN|nr:MULTISPECIES: ROK family transcriptional regulator [Streptomyces]MCX4232230.1 ROK family transcriptional regulator [Streptomyces ortus]